MAVASRAGQNVIAITTADIVVSVSARKHIVSVGADQVEREE